MRKHLTVLFLLLAICATSNATNYYIAANGNDANNGTSTSTPWKTLSKLNSFFSSLKPGDNVLLNRGDVFYGSITINSNGSSGSPITIGAYGTGANPIITGFTSVTAWTNKGGNIWESTNTVSSLSSCNMVEINGVNTAMGRTPNYPNYYNWNSHGTSGSNSTITSSLTGSPNWTGAELAIFTTSYKVTRHPIVSQSGGTISFTSSGDLWQNAPGYFFQQFQIQNDIRTLDTLNEWYYNPSTKKLDVYNNSMPTGVMLATVDNLISTNNKSNITIRDLTLTGASGDAISISSSSNIQITNCSISYIGGTAIYGITASTQPGLRIENNTINQVNNCGIDLKYWYTGNVISHNTIKNINMLIGMQNTQHTIEGGVLGINTESDNGIVSYNNLDSIGISAISFKGSNVSIDHNLVTNTCIGNAIRDLGAIYMWNGSNKTITGTKVFNNIVLNTSPWCVGIFCDEGSNGIEIYNNTAYNTLRGIYLDDSYNINVHDNTTFNTGAAGIGSGLFLNNNPGAPKLTNITLKNNKFIAKTSIDRSLWVITTDAPSMPKPFTSDSNYFAKPLGDNVNNIQTDMVGASYVQRTLASWQSLNGQDAHSKQSPKTITDINDFNFQYNATSSPVTISLPYNYIDITGASYNGSITLQPYTSAVLIKNGNITGNIPPKANAGSDKTITLPTNTVTLSGSGTDQDGTISSYAWTQLSGPSTSAIVSGKSASTVINSLVQGTYQFLLTVTDNKGATGKDTVQVAVNATGNLLPAANVSNTVNGLNYSYYQGSNSVIPNFSSLSPVKTGTVGTFDVSVASSTTSFAINYTGYIMVPTDGQYTFYTNSDDGSNLYIDGVLVVNNDGLHAALERSGTIGLKAGLHAISVGFIQASGGKSLTVSYSSSGISKQAIPASALYIVSSNGLLPATNLSNTVNGLNYSYYQGSNSVIPNFSSLTPAKMGTVSTFDISIANTTTSFSIDYTGYIKVPSDGQYTFYTNSDDGSNLYIDNRLIVSNDGLHAALERSGTIGLQAGLHSISVGFLQAAGNKSLTVSYSGSGISKQIIPASVLYIVSSNGLLPAITVSNPVNGLNYSYYQSNGIYSAIPDFSTTTPVKTGTISSFSLSPATRANVYSFNFSGYIKVPSDGQYTFYTTSDDGSKLYIDNVLVVNNDGLHSATEKSGTIGLQAGLHYISVGYFQEGGGNTLSVNYSGSGITKQVIPASALYTTSTSGGNTLAGGIADQNIISANQFAIRAYPNPFINSMTIDIKGGAGDYKLMLFDALGRVMWIRTGTKSEGSVSQSVNTSALQKGIYFLKLIQNNNSSVVKLEK